VITHKADNGAEVTWHISDQVVTVSCPCGNEEIWLDPKVSVDETECKDCGVTYRIEFVPSLDLFVNGDYETNL